MNPLAQVENQLAKDYKTGLSLLTVYTCTSERVRKKGKTIELPRKVRLTPEYSVFE